MRSVSVFTPESVSTVSVVSITARLSHRYFPTQRIAFPHIFPSLPSALNIRIAASAFCDGHIRTIPSAPTDRRRRAHHGCKGGGVERNLVRAAYIYVVVSGALHLREVNFHYYTLSSFVIDNPSSSVRYRHSPRPSAGSSFSGPKDILSSDTTLHPTAANILFI